MKLKQFEAFTLTKEEEEAWETIYRMFDEIRANAKTQGLIQIAYNICSNLDDAADYYGDTEEEE